MSSDQNGLSQLLVDVVSAILDGDDTTTPLVGDYSDGLAAVAAQGKKKAVQILVIGVDALDDVFLAFLCCRKRHLIHQLSGN